MIYFWQCERQEFVDYVSSRATLPRERLRHVEEVEAVKLGSDGLALVWASSPTERFSLPRAAIVREDKVQDFLAWVSTYFRNIRPFTGHCRVASPESATLAANAVSTRWPLDNRSVDLGLIVAETVAYSVGRMDTGRLPFSAFTRAMSFTYAKAVRKFDAAIKGDDCYLSSVAEGWSLSRELAGQPPLDLLPKDVAAVWSLVLKANTNSRTCNGDSVIIESLRELKKLGHITHDRWLALNPKSAEADALWEAMRGPREGRVLAVENAVQSLVRGTKATQRRRAFAAGYLASRVQPGTLDHLSLLFPFVSELRESLLWFGACAGLSPETTIDSYANGLGWLMRRELGRQVHWLDRPSCDIALPELRMLLETRHSTRPHFRTTSTGVLQVEIMPLVNTNVRWPDHDEEQPDKQLRDKQQGTLFQEGTRLEFEVREILRRLEDSESSLDAIRHHVERTFKTERLGRKKRR